MSMMSLKTINLQIQGTQPWSMTIMCQVDLTSILIRGLSPTPPRALIEGTTTFWLRILVMLCITKKG
jgi:hypothetical protein